MKTVIDRSVYRWLWKRRTSEDQRQNLAAKDRLLYRRKRERTALKKFSEKIFLNLHGGGKCAKSGNI